jgi:hypothetical protein
MYLCFCNPVINPIPKARSPALGRGGGGIQWLCSCHLHVSTTNLLKVCDMSYFPGFAFFLTLYFLFYAFSQTFISHVFSTPSFISTLLAFSAKHCCYTVFFFSVWSLFCLICVNFSLSIYLFLTRPVSRPWTQWVLWLAVWVHIHLYTIHTLCVFITCA